MNLKEISEEEKDKIIEKLMNKQATKNTNNTHDEALTFGQKLADKFADVAGSWPFIICFVILIVVWIGLNISQMFKPFDTYPFILLNLALSCVAALQAPIIMMSQNRHESKDRIKSEQDFQTNEKAEIIIEEILRRTENIEKIQLKQNEILEYLKNK